MVRKNPFKKLEYHVLSHADIEIFSVENNRLKNECVTYGWMSWKTFAPDKRNLIMELTDLPENINTLLYYEQHELLPKTFLVT